MLVQPQGVVAVGAAISNVNDALASAFPRAIERDAVCALLCGLAASSWVWVWSTLASAELIPPTVSRKIIHAGSAPLFMLCWPLFSDGPSACIAASFVPLLQVVRLAYAGRAREDTVGVDDGLIKAVSRTGSRSEVLGGPLIYTLVLFIATGGGFRSVVASTALCQMAVGDGLADIFGRRYGRSKWPFAPSKSYVGSAAFALSSFFASLGFVLLFNISGYTALTAAACAPALALISLLSAGAELLPWFDDNIIVPIAAAGLSALLLRG